MADISDVMHALRDVISRVLYPNGVPAGPAPASIAGAPVRVYVGWPDAGLDKDLANGICQVSIWPRPGVGTVLGAYLSGWREAPRPQPSLTATVTGDTVAFAGTGATPAQIAAVIVDRQAAYTYPMVAGDGPVQVAAALAAKISADRPASFSGASLVVPDATDLIVRVVVGGTARRESRRLVQSVQVIAWCPSAILRDAVIRRIDDALIEDNRTLDLPDGTKATITYEGTGFDEDARQQPMHRRDLILSVEYSQVREQELPGIAVPVGVVDPDPSRITQTTLYLGD